MKNPPYLYTIITKQIEIMTYNDTPTKRQQEFDILEGRIAESLMKLDVLNTIVERGSIDEHTKKAICHLIDAEWETHDGLMQEKRNF